ncbi:MAG TPA: ACT domain-containing protein, partial [Terriglobales bacterium]|nr:ACT domain-containing protein [Terriglobales bacterium]
LDEKANLVNAASIASSRGVSIQEERKAKGGGAAANVLSVVLKTSREERLVRGGVLHGESPRLLSIDGIDIEAPLERNLIYLRNRDVPGVIGRVGTILGDHKINIADFSLGRRQPVARAASAGAGKKTSTKQAGEAIAVVHVDTRVPEEVLEALREIPAMQSAKAIRL